MQPSTVRIMTMTMIMIIITITAAAEHAHYDMLCYARISADMLAATATTTYHRSTPTSY